MHAYNFSHDATKDKRNVLFGMRTKLEFFERKLEQFLM